MKKCTATSDNQKNESRLGLREKKNLHKPENLFLKIKS